MTEGASESKGVLERIASVKAEFEAVKAHLQAYSCPDETDTESTDGSDEVERLREAVHAMESASETYEQRKKSLEAQNAQMLIEIHEYESIRSQLQQMVVEETILAEQAQEEDSDDEDDEVADEAEQKHVAGSETESKPADN